MSPELKMYYSYASFEAIAKFRGISEPSIKCFLTRERAKLGLSRRLTSNGNTRDFIADKALVMELYAGGMRQTAIANKWDIAACTANRYLKEWCDDIRPDGASVNLNEFYNQWREVPDEFVVTVAKQPMFKVTRIAR